MSYYRFVKNDLFVFLLFLLIFYAIFRYSGSFDRGYDTYDDADIIITNQALDSNSFFPVLKKMIREDLEWKYRFRPVGIFYFLTTVKFFGFNLKLINIYLALLCICTSFLLYKFFSNIGFSFLQSVLFALLSLNGPAIIMWVQCPTVVESSGMLFLSLSLFFLSKSIYSEKTKLLYKSCFIISIFLCTLCKENFLIITPAILFLYVWLYSLKNNTGIILSLKKNYIIIILTSIFSFAVLIYIFKFVGISNQYAGVDINLFSGKLITDFIDTVFKTNIFFVILFGIFILLDNESQNIKLSSNYFKIFISTFLFPFSFILLIIIPQFILYYRSGFFVGRYLLPYLIGFTFFLIYLLKVIFDSKSVSSFVKYLYLSMIISYLFLEITTVTIPIVSTFSDRCKATSEMLRSIIKNPNKKLLMVMDPVANYQEVLSLKIYLDYLARQEEYKYDFIKTGPLNKIFSDALSINIEGLSYEKFGDNQIDSTKDNSYIGNILIFDGLNEKFLEKNKNWFNENNFRRKQFSFYTLYSNH